MTKNTIIIGLAIIASLLLFRSCQSNKQLKNISNDLEAKSKTIKTYRDANNNLTSKVRSAEIYNGELIAQSANLQFMLDEIKGKVTSATTIETSNKVSKTIETRIERQVDTLYIQDTLNIVDTLYSFGTPIYTSVFFDDFIELGVSATQDSTTFQLTTFDKFSMVTYTRRKLFKTYNEVLFKSHNPYSHNQKVQSYRLKQKPLDRFSFGLQAGYGLTPKGFLPYVGAGAQFKIY